MTVYDVDALTNELLGPGFPHTELDGINLRLHGLTGHTIGSARPKSGLLTSNRPSFVDPSVNQSTEYPHNKNILSLTLGEER